jgi:hypothetical protein
VRIPSVHEVVTLDHRNGENPPIVHDNGSLRIVSWNIELGYNLDDIVSRLTTLMPIDVLLLQEVDIVHERPHDDHHSRTTKHANVPPLSVDCVHVIASQLHMMAVFSGIYLNINHIRAPITT